jgi:hypothetical protein
MPTIKCKTRLSRKRHMMRYAAASQTHNYTPVLLCSLRGYNSLILSIPSLQQQLLPDLSASSPSRRSTPDQHQPLGPLTSLSLVGPHADEVRLLCSNELRQTIMNFLQQQNKAPGQDYLLLRSSTPTQVRISKVSTVADQDIVSKASLLLLVACFKNSSWTRVDFISGPSATDTSISHNGHGQLRRSLRPARYVTMCKQLKPCLQSLAILRAVALRALPHGGLLQAYGRSPNRRSACKPDDGGGRWSWWPGTAPVGGRSMQFAAKRSISGVQPCVC